MSSRNEAFEGYARLNLSAVLCIYKVYLITLRVDVREVLFFTIVLLRTTKATVVA